jgi:hypothetical protein
MLLSSALALASRAVTTELSVAGAAATSWEKVRRRIDANLTSFTFVLVGFLKRLFVEEVGASFSVPCKSDRILLLYCVVIKGIDRTVVIVLCI